MAIDDRFVAEAEMIDADPPQIARRPRRLGFIGGGRMAQALAAGLARSGAPDGSGIRFHDPVPAASAAFLSSVPGSLPCDDNRTLIGDSDVVLLAVKPHSVALALRDRQSDLRGRLVISVVAGLTLERLAELVGHSRLIRTMPNTPALVGYGASALAAGSDATVEDRDWARELFETVGLAIEVPESSLDAVTGLSGCGPAYVLAIIEGLADGGVRLGLPRDIAQRLAIRTVAGAALLAEQTGTHPAILREQVTSPGGATAAGLAALEEGAVKFHLQAAVTAAAQRAAELGRPSE